MHKPLSLRLRASLWVIAAMAAGGAATWIVMTSQAAWRDHLARAYVTGLAVHESLVSGAPAPAGVTITHLPGPPPLPPNVYETRITLVPGRPDPDFKTTGGRLSVRVQSPDLRYPAQAVIRFGGPGNAAGLASVTRLLASYCSTPRLYLQPADGDWLRVDGDAIWGCAAAPPDRRLWGLGLAALGLVFLLSRVGETSAAFTAFARALRDHRRGEATLPEAGPSELRDTAAAVNAYLTEERARLESRAMVLSGVSHDLGTPATRLRLRTALIDDPVLRGKIEADIDQMTSMIESVLSYTRAEIGDEPLRELSLSSLAEAVADDYRDISLPVRMAPAGPARIRARAAIFAAAGPRPRAAPEGPVLVRARPVALRRALCNLVDNALKYGREAEIGVGADADEAWITVTDRGSVLTAEDLSRLTGAFRQGGNPAGAGPAAGMGAGVGLGLAIVATIAGQHGGRLDFRHADGGLEARLSICRDWA